MNFDIIVIGGGIGGLYTTYQLLKKYSNINIALIEKENYLGGRIYTDSSIKGMTIEAGAGRLSSSHVLLMNLIHELGLSSKLVKISGEAVYVAAGEHAIQTYNSVLTPRSVGGGRGGRNSLVLPSFPVFFNPFFVPNITKPIVQSAENIILGAKPVSYTHLTLPTIYSV